MAVFFGGFAAGVACTLLAVARLLLYPNETEQQDPVKLLALITEINDLIAAKEQR
jgi:hypothetical protein